MRYFLIVYILFLEIESNAQTNLVPNGGFEIYDTCPSAFDQIYRAIGWHSTWITPDYFNSCAPSGGGINFSVPSNWFGYQYAASGNAYVGGEEKDGNFSERECFGTQLTAPLQIGTRYFVSFKVNLAIIAPAIQYCGINKLGALFSTINYTQVNPAPVCNCAQVYTDSVITDTTNWTRIKGSFIADSNYTFVNIGRFFDNTLTDSIQLAGVFCSSYYFFDDICVSTDSAFAYSYTFVGVNEIVENNIIDYFPNPARDLIEIIANGIQALKLLDVFGRIVYTCNTDLISPYIFNISSFSRGIYFLNVKTKSKIINKRIILN